MSVRQSIYDAYRAKLLECGATLDEANQAVEESKKLDDSLNRRCCPECTQAVTRVLDNNQVGHSLIKGNWYKYTCRKCEFFMCRIEPDPNAIS